MSWCVVVCRCRVVPSCCAVAAHTHSFLGVWPRCFVTPLTVLVCVVCFLPWCMYGDRDRPTTAALLLGGVRKQQTIETSTDFTPTGPIGHTDGGSKTRLATTRPPIKPFRELCVSNRSSMPSPAPEFGVLRAAPSWVVRPPDDITTRPRKVQVATPHPVRFRMALFPRNFGKKK